MRQVYDVVAPRKSTTCLSRVGSGVLATGWSAGKRKWVGVQMWRDERDAQMTSPKTWIDHAVGSKVSIQY